MNDLFQGILTPYRSTSFYSQEVESILQKFFISYLQALRPEKTAEARAFSILSTFATLVFKQLESPHRFGYLHEKIRVPIDYYSFGLELISPLIDFDGSVLLGQEYLHEMEEELRRGANVILLANHQTEPDPQIIDLLLQREVPSLMGRIRFVAGDRVLTDPLAVPFSLGRDLLCIYSKKHIDYPIEQKNGKLEHNRRALYALLGKFNEGGEMVYLAPSGGRDRADQDGKIAVSPFDPSSVELITLLASKSKRPCYFFPLALYTYDVLPPPRSVEQKLGERREAGHSAVFLAFGPRMDLEIDSSNREVDRVEKRRLRAKIAEDRVCELYEGILQRKSSLL